MQMRHRYCCLLLFEGVLKGLSFNLYGNKPRGAASICDEFELIPSIPVLQNQGENVLALLSVGAYLASRMLPF